MAAKYTFLGKGDRLALYKDDYLQTETQPPSTSTNVLSMVITFITYLVAVLTFPVSAFCCIKIIQDYERAVVFRLGRLQSLKGPGIIIVLPCIDKWDRVDMRVKAFNVPPQKIITKDQAAVLVGADVQFMIKDPIASKGVVQDLNHSIRVLAQTTLVNIMMSQKLIEIQTDKKFIGIHAQDQLNKATKSWGVQIHRIEISEPQVISAPPEVNPEHVISSLFKGSDNPVNTLFQVMQGAAGMMPQAFTSPQTQPQQTQQHSTSPGETNTGPDPGQLVALFNRNTDERLVQDIGCVYQFNISEGDTWHLDLKNGRGFAGKGPPMGHLPDVVISLSSEDLKALFFGEITPFNAYMQGRVTVDGDVRLAMKLQSVVDRMKQPRMPIKTTHARGDVMIV